MKSIILALLLTGATSWADTSVTTYVRPSAGTYDCQATRAYYESSEPTDIVYSTEDDFKLTILGGDKIVISTPSAVATLSSQGAVPSVRSGYSRPALRHDVVRWPSRKVLTRPGSGAFINYADLSPMDTLSSSRAFFLRVEFNHTHNTSTHWKRSYRCK